MAIRISKNPTKSGAKYYFDYTHDNKRYRSKLFMTKKEAVKAQADYILKGREKPTITFSYLVAEYTKKKKKTWKPSTYVTYIRRLEHIDKVLGDIQIDRLTQSQYDRFLDYLNNYTWVVKRAGKRVKKRYTAGYKNEIIILVRSLCKYSLNYYGVTTRVPFRTERYKETKPLLNYYTEEQFTEFIRHVYRTEYICLFTFLMYTGCRRGEALALRFDDIDFKKKTVNITKTLAQKQKGVPRHDTAPKTASSIRTLPLTDKAYKACLQMKELYSKKKRFETSWRVFGGTNPLPETTIDRIKDKAIKESGLPKIRIHDFRHSFVPMLISKGADVSIISKYVGHSSIKQTLDTYTHMYQSKMEEIIKNL